MTRFETEAKGNSEIAYDCSLLLFFMASLLVRHLRSYCCTMFHLLLAAILTVRLNTEFYFVYDTIIDGKRFESRVISLTNHAKPRPEA